MATNRSETLTVLFADIADSTKLYDTIGDSRAHAIVAETLEALTRIARNHGGSLVRTIGDEVLCTFDTPDDAAEAAVTMQETVALEASSKQWPLNLRIGFHHGEVLHQGIDIFGDTVNVAARMVSQAKADQIITTRQTMDIMDATLHGETRLVDQTRVKGKAEVMELFEIKWGKPEEMTMMGASKGRASSEDPDRFAECTVIYQEQEKIVNRMFPSVTLGRNPSNHVVVPHRLVSRQHARIELRRGKFILIDQSTNGTFLAMSNRKPLLLRRDETPLEGEGLIGLGAKVNPQSPEAIQFRCEGILPGT